MSKVKWGHGGGLWSCVTNVLLKGDISDSETHTQGERHVRTGGLLAQAGKPPEARRGLDGSFPRAFEGHGPADALVSDFWPPGWETMQFCCSKPPSLRYLLRPPQETSSASLQELSLFPNAVCEWDLKWTGQVLPPVRRKCGAYLFSRDLDSKPTKKDFYENLCNCRP